MSKVAPHHIPSLIVGGVAGIALAMLWSRSRASGVHVTGANAFAKRGWGMNPIPPWRSQQHGIIATQGDYDFTGASAYAKRGWGMSTPGQWHGQMQGGAGYPG